MTSYVLAHHGEDAGRRRLALLDEFHGPVTLAQLEAADVRPGWRCLEVGAGSGALTAWLGERASPGGGVLAIDIETHWLEQLASDVIEVLQADVTTIDLPADAFDLVVARMLLLHLPDPAEVCRRLTAATAPGGCLVVQDADFRPVSLSGATDAETAGLEVMIETMRSGGVHLALGPELESLVEGAGAEIVEVQAIPSPSRGGEIPALITVATLQRFRDEALRNGATQSSIAAAIRALEDPERAFVGPTQWIVRGQVPT
jgi:SAM-dependent methyltransferase